jgi:hypothetical protein
VVDRVEGMAAGRVNLMIPPGTAVRDAHACYEVVVLDGSGQAQIGSLLLITITTPHCRPNRAIHTSANTDEIPLCRIVRDYDI